MKRYQILLTTLFLVSCGNSSNVVSTSSVNNSSNLNSSSSKSSLTSSISTSNDNEMITKDFVINKLNSTVNKSYTLSYKYEGIIYNDIFVPNMYYYNDMMKGGSLIANLYGEDIYAFDYNVYEGEVFVSNQSYGTNGNQGQKSLNYVSIGDNDYSSMINNLELTENGVKLTERSYVDMLTAAIYDGNSFDYIIFNNINGDLSFDFYYKDQVYDGYSYVLKDIGSSKNEIIYNYLNNISKYTGNAIAAQDTFKTSKSSILGTIDFWGGSGNRVWESIDNSKIDNGNTINYSLVSESNGVSYRQLFVENSENEIYKVGLNGSNEIVNTLTELTNEELYPVDLLFMDECFLADEESNAYLYLGSNSNDVISYLLPNMSSIIKDANITKIEFIVNENKITSFSFVTNYYSLESDYGLFAGSFNVYEEGFISQITPIEPDNEETVINELFNNLIGGNANFTLESKSYSNENGTSILSSEKHVINYVNNVYFDANYRVNNDSTLTLQFANGYVVYNEKVYSFRYDATIQEIDNVRETSFKSIGEAIFSLKAEVIDFEEKNILYINENVTEIKDNVEMLEQAGLIDPSTMKFYLNEELTHIEKITYKYGNAYTSAYVETLIDYGSASIDEEILEKLNAKLPQDSEIEEKYMKDSNDEYVLEIYGYLKDEYLGDKADYIPFVPGIENSIDIIWIDYPEGYQYLISDSPSNYLTKFKEALVTIYGYTKISENEYINTQTGLKIEIREDTGYQQIYISSI